MMGPIFASCEETEARLSDQLEGELHGLRAWRVARHLAHCIRCNQTLRSLARTIDQLHKLSRTDMTPPHTAPAADTIIERIKRTER